MRSSICPLCADARGQPEEAAKQFDWLERQPEDDHLARVTLRFRRGLRSHRSATERSSAACSAAGAKSSGFMQRDNREMLFERPTYSSGALATLLVQISMSTTIYLDEAGNTGGNLLDEDQPFYCLASVDLTAVESLPLLASRATEHKFSTLKRSRPGQETILRLLSAPVLASERYVISLFHKRYMAMTKLVDLLVEPVAHMNGLDLYERGGNLALANLLYFTLPTFLGRQVVNLLMDRFVTMVRQPSLATLAKFYRLIDTALRKHSGQDYIGELAMIRASEPVARASLNHWNGSDLDPAIPAFIQHGSIWTGRLGVPFDIVHDEAKPIFNEQLVLEAMMSATDPPASIGYDRRKMAFPITATGIAFASSDKIIQLQIADILASSIAYAIRSAELRDGDQFAEDIRRTSIFNGPVSMVWPEPKVTPAELGTDEVGGQDSADIIGRYVSDRLGGIPPPGQRRKP